MPTLEELEAQVLSHKLTVPVYLIDRTRVELPYDIGTTVGSCIPHIGHLINLDNYGTFGLFISRHVCSWRPRTSSKPPRYFSS